MAKRTAAVRLVCLRLCIFLLVTAAHDLTEDGACSIGEGAGSRGLTLLQKQHHTDAFREKQRVSAATFESARPPSCCSSGVHTSWIWSRDSTLFANNISDNLPVVVPCGHELTIDESILQILPGLEVRGSVTFQDGVDIVVKTSYVFVCGSFSIGRSTPHISKVDLVLTGGKNVSWPMPGGGLASFGSGGFITFGGDTYIRGSACEAPAWTRLTATVQEEEEDDENVGTEFSGNLAFHQPSKQSSVAHHRYTADKAVDGIFHWKGSSILTKVEENPWWYVEIPTQAKIGIVTLSNRGHRGVNLAPAIVGLTNSPCMIGHLCGGDSCIHSLTRAGKEDFDCAGARGAYLYVQLSGLRHLTLSEVEVNSVTVSSFDLQLKGSLHTAWKAGDKLIITSTSSSAEETEEVSVVSASEAGVEVSGRLLFKHEGCATDTCVLGAEVASLSRNVVIRGANGCDPVCGHFMIAHTPRGYVCGVEFTNLGQTAVEGRYPLHVHMPGEAPDIVLKGNALHHNINRGLVLHGVHNATAESNLCFRTKGHCFMLEDAVEQHNVFKGNMGVLPSPLDFGGCRSTHGDMFCPDRGDNSPNPFWISNPNNIFLFNLGIATGVAFNFEPRHVRGLTRREFPLEAHKIGAGGKIKGRVPLEEFRGNMAHSSGMGLNNYPRMCLPARAGAKNEYEDFTAWRCGVGMSAHNSPTCRMPFVRARLYENAAAARGGLSASRIDLIECKMTARNADSIPLMINRYGKTDVQFLPQVFRVDNYTRSWARCHGSFANNSYFSMFTEGDYASACPPE